MVLCWQLGTTVENCVFFAFKVDYAGSEGLKSESKHMVGILLREANAFIRVIFFINLIDDR